MGTLLAKRHNLQGAVKVLQFSLKVRYLVVMDQVRVRGWAMFLFFFFLSNEGPHKDTEEF